jgi:hypothetical protein
MQAASREWALRPSAYVPVDEAKQHARRCEADQQCRPSQVVASK